MPWKAELHITEQSLEDEMIAASNAQPNPADDGNPDVDHSHTSSGDNHHDNSESVAAVKKWTIRTWNDELENLAELTASEANYAALVYHARGIYGWIVDTVIPLVTDVQERNTALAAENKKLVRGGEALIAEVDILRHAYSHECKESRNKTRWLENFLTRLDGLSLHAATTTGGEGDHKIHIPPK